MSEPSKRGQPIVHKDPALAEWLAKQQAEYLWCLAQPEIMDAYPGRVVVVHNRTIMGSGRDHLEALEDARQRAAQRNEALPKPYDMLFIPVPEQATDGFVPSGLASSGEPS
jgi:hypothetical protein